MTSKTKQVLLSISIALVFVFFIAYGIQTFYESKDYSDFCDEIVQPVSTQAECEALNGEWTSTSAKPIAEDRVLTQQGWCDAQAECRQEYQDFREVYNRNVFIITAIIGLAAVIIGIILTHASVSVGIMAGGILTLFYGTLIFWGDMSKYLRFIILGLVLIILILSGYKKLTPKK